MSAEELYLLFTALICVPIIWLLPQRLGADGVAVWTAFSLFLLSPLTATWLLISSIVTLGVLKIPTNYQSRSLLIACWGVALIGGLLLPREISVITLVGSAYFTLRNLHILIDGFLGHMAIPSLREIFRYQFFGPVMLAGPIHRLPNFTRSLNRRRFENIDLANGAERALFGLALATILGGYVLERIITLTENQTLLWPVFLAQWFTSALEWIQLYFVFAGLSSFAIGLSLMMGIRIEENFNHPYRAKSLLDFWTRWHMSLSFWCRDYVFQPISAITRQPVLGLLAAMVTIGIWHETSWYYLLWGGWQVIGIVGNRLLLKAWPENTLKCPEILKTIVTPLFILGWLSLAKPVINLLLGEHP